MKTLNIFSIVCACVISIPDASAENNSAASAVEQLPPVEVVGSTDIDWKPYRTMLKGLDAFDQHHDLAPAALPRFILRSRQTDLKLENLSLAILGEKSSIDVPIAPDWVFELPRDKAAADENAEVMLNAKKGVFHWRPYIRSPNVPSNVLRLGDLRLECEMRWAVERDSLSFSHRSMLGLLGGPCKSSIVKVLYPASQKLIGIRLVSGARNESLPSDRFFEKGLIFSPPIHDQTWPDDTLLLLQVDRASSSQKEKGWDEGKNVSRPDSP